MWNKVDVENGMMMTDRVYYGETWIFFLIQKTNPQISKTTDPETNKAKQTHKPAKQQTHDTKSMAQQNARVQCPDRGCEVSVIKQMHYKKQFPGQSAIVFVVGF